MCIMLCMLAVMQYPVIVADVCCYTPCGWWPIICLYNLDPPQPPVCAHSLPKMSSDPSIAPPPIYAQRGPNSPQSLLQFEPQILIIPATDSLRFQQGFLGADGERAAIEGELQVKGTDSVRWRKVSVIIRVLASRSPAEPRLFYPQGRWTSAPSRPHMNKSSNSPKRPSSFTNTRTTRGPFSRRPFRSRSHSLRTHRSVSIRHNHH
jgi:hypothetical protein